MPHPVLHPVLLSLVLSFLSVFRLDCEQFPLLSSLCVCAVLYCCDRILLSTYHIINTLLFRYFSAPTSIFLFPSLSLPFFLSPLTFLSLSLSLSLCVSVCPRCRVSTARIKNRLRMLILASSTTRESRDPRVSTSPSPTSSAGRGLVGDDLRWGGQPWAKLCSMSANALISRGTHITRIQV